MTLQNNQATYTTTVVAPPAGPDLALTKSGPAQVIAGATMDYAVTVVNIGDLPAFGVVITDSLPGAVTFIDSSHPSYNTTYAGDSHSVVWAVGTLAAARDPGDRAHIGGGQGSLGAGVLVADRRHAVNGADPAVEGLAAVAGRQRPVHRSRPPGQGRRRGLARRPGQQRPPLAATSIW